jgi:hypothetical protein
VRILLVIASAFIIAGIAHEQTPWQAPRNWLGHPDLQGVWTNDSVTRLARA